MCGIAGFLGQGNKEILEKMVGVLRHRGPDDEGFYLEPTLGLGHRRLSIIDLKTGHQPLTNENNNIWLIFNGEIYNFQEIRKKLIAQGHKFSTQSDSEVIVHLYEAKQEDFLKELEGMFALALWDKLKKKLILARDRLGEKPLFYAYVNQTLIFGSEIKALLQYPKLSKTLDHQNLAKYLAYEYVPAPHSIFQNIFKLGPGQYLVSQSDKVKIQTYWDIKFDTSNQTLTEKEYLSELEHRIDSSVKKRLVADVPLGVFLSGGLDSTALVYFAQKNSSQKIKTFSIGFEDKSFDESEYAFTAARFLKTDHDYKVLTSKDCLALIPKVVDFLDEPLADASIVPTYLLSHFTRQKVKVALSGDGGDELFLGYPTFQAYRLDRIYQRLPRWLRLHVISFLVNHLPTSFNNFSFDFKLKKFIASSEAEIEIKNQLWLGSFSPNQIRELLIDQAGQPISTSTVFSDLFAIKKRIRHEAEINRLIYLYLKNYLQDDILVKTDRASMANSLEVRAPYLDHNVVDYINNMPANLKLRGWQTKYIFKQLMQDKLPKNIVFRPKKGFGLPIAKWLNQELKPLVLDVFQPTKIKKESIFNEKYITKLLQEHFSKRKDHRKLIWTLLIFELWLERWTS